MRHAVIVAGPTASGKSALAMGLAARLGATVINADSMQVYRELRIVTARPSEADEAAVPHRLYGVRAAAEAGNAAWWRAAALAEMEACSGLPILCGGTGLYLSALVRGIADIPEPETWARAEARGLVDEIGVAALHARLMEADPVTAAGLRSTDGQRVARAWEVWRSTGRGLRNWQSDATPPSDWRFSVVLLDPPRDGLREAIAHRFNAMLEAGALDEVRDLLALRLDPGLPLMRALGVPELAAYLRDEIDLAAAVARANLATGQFIKRQATWFRGQKLADVSRVHTIHARIAGLAQFSEREWGGLLNFIQHDG